MPRGPLTVLGSPPSPPATRSESTRAAEYLPSWQSGSGNGALQTRGLPLGVERHPTHGEKTLKAKLRSKFLPCVLARGCISATSPQLWPAAPRIAKLYREERDSICRNATKKARRASVRHCHLSSALERTRGVCKVQQEPVAELEQPSDVLQEVEHQPTCGHMKASARLAKRNSGATNKKRKPAVNTSVRVASLP